MNNKQKIKIVKKSEIAERAKVPVKRYAARKAAREMVATVADWVTEFKSRKSDETKVAIEQLFASRTQPNES